MLPYDSRTVSTKGLAHCGPKTLEALKHVAIIQKNDCSTSFILVMDILIRALARSTLPDWAKSGYQQLQAIPR